ncbi:hypothetical protein GCK72_012797 [Caenorhabditis remanei]|uniref:F-box domain-containing protein n=1 Tax=Caenorhabditis remanei TaxID=31234 RepID=A0A6A5GNX3_CAERE|nr:hypothetical protein GCK72_012797 [Caenorhabditis remanei]KAF1756344.1 hypothetical protein GCK72_012797 [Caenorhabditis remanei]
MTTAFPLLRLPYLVLMPILEQMEFMERIVLSVLSKRARMFVKLLKMNCGYIILRIKYGTIEMKVLLDRYKELKLEMYPSGYLEFRYEQDVFLCNTMRVPPMDYAGWVMDVLHCDSIHMFRIAEISPCNIFPLLVNLPKIDCVEVHNDLSAVSLVNSRLIKVLRIVLPVSSVVAIPDFFLNLKYHREILQGNFDELKMENDWKKNVPNRKIKFSLNDLRITNAKTLELLYVSLNVKDLNLFFKLWMKKKCNARLEYLGVRQKGNFDKDLLLKGLNAVPVPIERNRTFRILGKVQQLRLDEETSAEFDITRVDGRTATIISNGDDTFHFYVWPESTNDATNIEPNQLSFMRVFSWFSSFYNSCVDRFK